MREVVGKANHERELIIQRINYQLSIELADWNVLSALKFQSSGYVMPSESFHQIILHKIHSKDSDITRKTMQPSTATNQH